MWLCSSPSLNKVAGNEGDWGVVGVMLCLSEGQVGLRGITVPSSLTMGSQRAV